MPTHSPTSSLCVYPLCSCARCNHRLGQFPCLIFETLVKATGISSLYSVCPFTLITFQFLTTLHAERIVPTFLSPKRPTKSLSTGLDMPVKPFHTLYVTYDRPAETLKSWLSVESGRNRYPGRKFVSIANAT
jgi:hypothetical protein